MARKARPDYRRLAAADLSDLSLGAGRRPPTASRRRRRRLPPVAASAAACPPACRRSLPLSADPPAATFTDALGTDFRALHSELLSFGGYRTTGARSLPPAQLTREWLQQNGAFRPTLIPAAPAAARELGIALPEGSLTVDRLASRIGIATEVCGGGGRQETMLPMCQLVFWLATAASPAYSGAVHDPLARAHPRLLCRYTPWMCRRRERARAGRCTRCAPPSQLATSHSHSWMIGRGAAPLCSVHRMLQHIH